mmetsp:Transcript_4523/g.12625  ORF Transcript_4523/g.12625 Transcript_4523/m.12625 type:complete len:226 (-) Transcript_4523:1254-1931(-)
MPIAYLQPKKMISHRTRHVAHSCMSSLLLPPSYTTFGVHNQCHCAGSWVQVRGSTRRSFPLRRCLLLPVVGVWVLDVKQVVQVFQVLYQLLGQHVGCYRVVHDWLLRLRPLHVLCSIAQNLQGEVCGWDGRVDQLQTQLRRKSRQGGRLLLCYDRRHLPVSLPADAPRAPRLVDVGSCGLRYVQVVDVRHCREVQASRVVGGGKQQRRLVIPEVLQRHKRLLAGG